MNTTKNQTYKQEQKNQRSLNNQPNQQQKSRHEQEPKKQGVNPSTLRDTLNHQDHEQEHPETRMTR
jgi:hypothetical protein